MSSSSPHQRSPRTWSRSCWSRSNLLSQLLPSHFSILQLLRSQLLLPQLLRSCCRRACSSAPLLLRWMRPQKVTSWGHTATGPSRKCPAVRNKRELDAKGWRHATAEPRRLSEDVLAQLAADLADLAPAPAAFAPLGTAAAALTALAPATDALLQPPRSQLLHSPMLLWMRRQKVTIRGHSANRTPPRKTPKPLKS